MALFGGSRDVSLYRSLNRELINDIVNTEVAIHKISIEETKQNIYGESSKKIYYSPVRINCLIQRELRESFGDDDISNFTNSVMFYFLRDDLKDLNLYLSEGDILYWDMEYFELSLVTSEDLWTGRNPETLLATTVDGYDEFGYRIAVTAVGHKITPDKSQLEDIRTGLNLEYNK